MSRACHSEQAANLPRHPIRCRNQHRIEVMHVPAGDRPAGVPEHRPDGAVTLTELSGRGGERVPKGLHLHAFQASHR